MAKNIQRIFFDFLSQQREIKPKHGLLVGVVAAVSAWILPFMIPAFAALEEDLLDSFLRRFPGERLGDDIVIVGIEDRSDVSRCYIADLIDKLSQGKPKVIALDFIFESLCYWPTQCQPGSWPETRKQGPVPGKLGPSDGEFRCAEDEMVLRPGTRILHKAFSSRTDSKYVLGFRFSSATEKEPTEGETNGTTEQSLGPRVCQGVSKNSPNSNLRPFGGLIFDSGPVQDPNCHQGSDFYCESQVHSAECLEPNINHVLLSDSQLTNQGFLLSPKRQGLVREYLLTVRHGGAFYPSLALAAVQAFRGDSLSAENWDFTFEDEPLYLNERGFLRINYYRSKTLPRRLTARQGAEGIELSSAEKTKSDEDFIDELRGKLVLVGVTDPNAEGGGHQIPVSAGLMPGVEIHATVAANLLGNDLIRAYTFVGRSISLLGLLGMSLMIGRYLATGIEDWRKRLIKASIITALWPFVCFAAFGLFKYHLLIVVPTLAGALSVVGGLALITLSRDRQLHEQLKKVKVEVTSSEFIKWLGDHQTVIAVAVNVVRPTHLIRSKQRTCLSLRTDFRARAAQLADDNKGKVVNEFDDVLWVAFLSPADALNRCIDLVRDPGCDGLVEAKIALWEGGIRVEETERFTTAFSAAHMITEQVSYSGVWSSAAVRSMAEDSWKPEYPEPPEWLPGESFTIKEKAVRAFAVANATSNSSGRSTPNQHLPRRKGGPINLFVARHEKADASAKELKKRLRHLIASGRLELFDSGGLQGGDEKVAVPLLQIKKCHFVIVLASSTFLDSDFWQQEAGRWLVAKRKQQRLRIVPVLLEACNWEACEALRGLRQIPEEPLTRFREAGQLDLAWHQVCTEIEEQIEGFAGN